MNFCEKIVKNKKSYSLLIISLLGIVFLINYLASNNLYNIIIYTKLPLSTILICLTFLSTIPLFIVMFLFKFRGILKELKRIKKYSVTLIEKDYDLMNTLLLKNEELQNKILYIGLISIIAVFVFFLQLEIKDFAQSTSVENKVQTTSKIIKTKKQSLEEKLKIIMQKLENNEILVNLIILIILLTISIIGLLKFNTSLVEYYKHKVALLIHEKTILLMRKQRITNLKTKIKRY